jgi:hypothetical protein
MAPRRLLPLTTALLLALGLGSCAKNETTAPGVNSEILVRETGPVGVAPSTLGPAAWAVNSIDSVLFVDDIDSARTEVMSFQLFETVGNTGALRAVPGTVRFAPSNAYIFYTGAFPSAAVDLEIKNPPARTTLSKMYFVPDAPLHGHTEYIVQFTSGIRMEKGALRRDVRTWTFTTGDSIAPPAVRN